MSTYQTYGEKLKHPKWQRKRLEILQRDDFTCQVCRSTEIELHVHHKGYVAGRDPWEYGQDELVTLCKNCHGDTEEVQARTKLALARLTPEDAHRVLGYIESLSAREEDLFVPTSVEWFQGLMDSLSPPQDRNEYSPLPRTARCRPYSRRMGRGR